MRYVFSELVQQISERENNPSSSAYKRFVGLEHYESGKVEITKYGDTSKLDSAMKVFHSGDILVARRNVYLRRAGVVFFDGLTSGDSIVLRATNHKLERLLPFVLNTDNFWDYADQHSDGTMSKRLSPKMLLDYTFEVEDSIDIDKAADILWTTAELEKDYENLLTRTDELIQSQFIEMFGDPETVVKTADHTVSEVADVQVGLVIKPTRFYSKDGTGTPAFRSLNVGPMRINDSDWVYFTDKGMEENPRTIAHTGDVLVVRSGYPGTSCVVTPEYNGRNVVDLIIAHPKKEIMLPEFLCAYTNFPHGKMQIESSQRGVAQKHFNVSLYNNMKIIIPSLDLQQDFISILQQGEKSKKALRKSIEALRLTRRAILMGILGNGGKE